MRYLIAKEFDKKGCIAVKTRHGKALADFTEKLQKQMGGYVVSKTLNFIVIFEELRRNLGLFF